MKNMVPFNSTDHSISQCYAWACRGTTTKVGKMQLQTIPNMYLSVESLAMIKGPVNSFLQERKVFLQRHQISLCHDKVPALLAKRLRKRRGCFGPWKCMKEQQRKKLLTCLRTRSRFFLSKQCLSHLFNVKDLIVAPQLGIYAHIYLTWHGVGNQIFIFKKRLIFKFHIVFVLFNPGYRAHFVSLDSTHIAMLRLARGHGWVKVKTCPP